jgi:hypothetical protein
VAHLLELRRLADSGANPPPAPVLSMKIADEHVEAVARFLEQNMGALLALRGAFNIIRGLKMQKAAARPRPGRRLRKRR